MAADRPRKFRLASRVLLGLLTVACGLSVGGYLYLRADYSGVFLRERGSLAAVREQFLYADPGFDNLSVALTDSHGRELACLVRVPRNPKGRLPAIVAIDGYDAGKKVVSLFESTTYAVLISFDWPDDQGHRYQGMNIAPFLAGIRGSVMRMISMVPLAVDYLAGRPDVDPEKIFVVGASLGVPIAADAAAIDPRIRAVVLAYGGGDITRLAAHSSRTVVPEAWKRTLLSWWVGAALAPVEPSKYVGRISPRPLLMINGNEDQSIPRECVEALYSRAREPRKLIWLETGHVAPELKDLIGRMEGIVDQWLVDQGLR